MLEHHDLGKLVARGFCLKEESCRDYLDGVSAYLQFGADLRVQIYQGCEGEYELKGQGRGRPKVHVLTKYVWFTPSWYVGERKDGEWRDIAKGSSETVDDAIEAVLARVRELFPTLKIAE